MNYYNPYYSMYPVVNTTNNGLFSRLFGGINFSSILNGTQKTLNIVNQTIPLIKQATPIIRNTKTMFKVMNEFKKIDTPTQTNSRNNKTENNIIEKEPEIRNTSSGPTFFV